MFIENRIGSELGNCDTIHETTFENKLTNVADNQRRWPRG